MTRINKPVSRATRESYAVLYAKARPIVVSIRPGDVLEFRELGRRGRWLLSIATAFRHAVELQAWADKAPARSAAAVKANVTRKIKRGVA